MVNELLKTIQTGESFIPSQFNERGREDRMRSVSLARKKLALQQHMRNKNPHLSPAEFKRHWLAFCAMQDFI